MNKDVNYRSHVDEEGVCVSPINWQPPENPKDFSDVLKFSRCHNTLVTGITLEAGKEDAIDAVRGNNYTIQKVNISCNGSRNGITVKGAIQGFTLEGLFFLSHGTKSDIELGQFDNYWYPGRPSTRDGTLRNVMAVDKKKVKIVVWDAEVPYAGDNVDAEVQIIPKFIWFPYFLFRYVSIRVQNLLGADIKTK